MTCVLDGKCANYIGSVFRLIESLGDSRGEPVVLLYQECEEQSSMVVHKKTPLEIFVA